MLPEPRRRLPSYFPPPKLSPALPVFLVPKPRNRGSCWFRSASPASRPREIASCAWDRVSLPIERLTRLPAPLRCAAELSSSPRFSPRRDSVCGRGSYLLPNPIWRDSIGATTCPSYPLRPVPGTHQALPTLLASSCPSVHRDTEHGGQKSGRRERHGFHGSRAALLQRVLHRFVVPPTPRARGRPQLDFD